MKPFGNRVLVNRLSSGEVEGVNIPPGTTLNNEPCIGEVIAVPSHRKDVKVGDRIIFAPAQSLKIYVENKEQYIVSYDVVFCVL
jgi:co-chaperonin GroES (HSP10)